MLEVLDHDDDIDIEPALVALGGLELTGLNDTLRAVLKDWVGLPNRASPTARFFTYLSGATKLGCAWYFCL